MQLQESLSYIDYLQVTDSDSCETFCGSDQVWFPTEQQRLTGCGPSAAANILFYIDRKENADCCGRDRATLLSFMEDAWKSVTLGKKGIPSTTLFMEKIRTTGGFRLPQRRESQHKDLKPEVVGTSGLRRMLLPKM